MSLYVA